MLISDEHQLILMLPQKCGSETLQSRLKELHSCAEIGSSPYYEPNVKRYLSKHITLRVARKLPAYQQRQHYRKVCFVRNPYDRVYSWFCWQHRLSEKPLPVESPKQKYAIARELEGDEASLQRTQRIRRNLKLKMDAACGEFNRYIELNPESYGPLHEFTHVWRCSRMDFIGYVEKFEDDYEAMCRRYGIDTDSAVCDNVLAKPKASCDPHRMEAEDYKSLPFYEKRTIDFVNRRFKRDFKCFGYEMLEPEDFPQRLG
jgi:hypothetical protein